jgi:hypothetical protein
MVIHLIVGLNKIDKIDKIFVDRQNCFYFYIIAFTLTSRGEPDAEDKKEGGQKNALRCQNA